jgi:molybdopterin-guanine dinucleotide biosynthesis protein A
MGRDKALIEIEGVPLLRRVCEVAGDCCDRVLVITPRVEIYQPLLPPGCDCIREVFQFGATVPHGPLLGFAQGLPHVKTEWVLLLACDLPNLKAKVIQSWMQQLETVPKTTIALLPKHTKGWEPLCGFYRRTCERSLQAFLTKFQGLDSQAKQPSFQQWLRGQNVQALSEVENEMLFNCNKFADLGMLAVKIW